MLNPIDAQMMKYVLLVYRDKELWEAMSVSERAAFEQAFRAGEQDLVYSLHLVDASHLQTNTALTVRNVDGNISITDGLAVSGQEQPVQLLYIQARDFNAAVQIASRLPRAHAGPIEVIPVS